MNISLTPQLYQNRNVRSERSLNPRNDDDDGPVDVQITKQPSSEEWHIAVSSGLCKCVCVVCKVFVY
jgi:hypothetical protein